MTVRGLGRRKWSIGLVALRAIPMKSCLRQRDMPGALVGTMVMRETK